MTFSPLAFFSFVELSDATQHRRYNEWHQLDHRPENLALPGVAWGDRWARPTAFAELSRTAARFEAVDYVAMYWFREPLAESLAEWDALGEASFQWGRGPIIPGVRRSLLAFFRPVKGYASPRALVAPEVLPFRPNRGLHLTLESFAEPHSPAAHERFAWEDRELMPRLLQLDGVAGAWTFSFSHPQRHSTLPLDGDATDAPGSMRLRLVYLDGDPLEVSPAVAELSEARDAAADGARVEFSGPVKAIIPWQDR
ncbi:hypothetical protein ACEXQE_21565 [Herbiconiux sp. P17]|uniref:hypothetical protein n=1 Tax=Herbiconiux wuyangfengii TaxID=3342794 RepID=UPI0035BB965F